MQLRRVLPGIADPFEAEELSSALGRAAQGLDALADTYRRGRLLNEGVPCAIVGRPNAGKSTLFNALLGRERAIVTDIPGTTRDTVEERVSLGGGRALVSRAPASTPSGAGNSAATACSSLSIPYPVRADRER